MSQLTNAIRSLGSRFWSRSQTSQRQTQPFHAGTPDRKPGRDAYADQRALVRSDGPTVIFDVGANVGNTVQRYRELFPDGIIHAFEPDPATFARLEARFHGDSRVHPTRAVVSDFTGTKRFHVNGDPATSSLLPRPRSGRRYYNRRGVTVAEIDVPSTSLDDFCLAHRIDHIEVLKLDVQGGELLTLEGATRLLSRTAVTLIYSEVEFIALYEGQPLFHDICRFLEGFQYSLYGIYDLVIAANGQLRFANAVFIPPRVREESLDRFEPEPY